MEEDLYTVDSVESERQETFVFLIPKISFMVVFRLSASPVNVPGLAKRGEVNFGCSSL